MRSCQMKNHKSTEALQFDILECDNNVCFSFKMLNFKVFKWFADVSEITKMYEMNSNMLIVFVYIKAFLI